MTRRRVINDGLPHRVYERRGQTTYSIGYKRKDGTWGFKLACPVSDQVAIKKLRRDAIRRALSLTIVGTEIETLGQLAKDWFSWQHELPAKSNSKRAASTLAENEREAKNLVEVFGEMAIVDIQAHHAYTYLDKCDALGRGPKGNKEIQLFQVILQRAVRKGIINVNPVHGVEKLSTEASTRYVDDSELSLALEVGKKCGGQAHRASLALALAFLCVRRSTEVLDADWSIVCAEGLLWTEGKTKANQVKKTVLINWSDQLREIVDELMKLDGLTQYPLSGHMIRTQDGSRYTRGGWKATLRRLMQACAVEAEKRGMQFKNFSMQDLRPKGVTDKLTKGHTDVKNATMHKSARMIEKIYDRRKKLVATPAG